jgi:hypothetical protein
VPSWRVHRAVYERLRREVPGIVKTPGLLERIDEVIDRAYGEHDLGVKPDPASFNRLLRALWLESGDIYDTRTGRFLGTSREEREKFEWEPPVNPSFEEGYLLEVPDDALMLATLHHLLDAATYCLINTYPPITAERSDLMIDCAVRAISPYLYQLEKLKTTWGTPYKQVLDNLIAELRKRRRWLYTLRLKYVRSKGLRRAEESEEDKGSGEGCDAYASPFRCVQEALREAHLLRKRVAPTRSRCRQEDLQRVEARGNR